MERGELPDPLVPPEVDLRGYEFMPYYGDRLRDSDLNSRATDAEYRAAHNLWWSSWKQVPAASLPDDDVALAKLADLGRNPKIWKKVKNVALRGFILCSDGRMYHKVLSEVAIHQWKFRQDQRDRTEAARNARLLRRQSQSVSHGQSQNKNASVTASATSSVTASIGEDRISKPSESFGLPSEGTRAGAMAKILRSLGVQITPSNPHLIDWLALGLTEASARDAVTTVRDRKPGTQPISAGYLSPIVLEILNPEKRPLAELKVKPWFIASWSAIVEKGKALGIEQAAGEQAPAFRARIYAAAGITDEQLRQAEAEFRT